MFEPLLVCQALPHVSKVQIDAMPQAELQDVPQLLLRCKSICEFTVNFFGLTPTLRLLRELLMACALAAGSQRPSGRLAVHLPLNFDETYRGSSLHFEPSHRSTVQAGPGPSCPLWLPPR
jgi:hypothetical protein